MVKGRGKRRHATTRHAHTEKHEVGTLVSALRVQVEASSNSVTVRMQASPLPGSLACIASQPSRTKTYLAC